MEFIDDSPSGWHVLIGDNGAGKSSIVRGIAAALIGKEEITAIRPDWKEWLTFGESEGEVSLELNTLEIFREMELGSNLQEPEMGEGYSLDYKNEYVRILIKNDTESGLTIPILDERREKGIRIVKVDHHFSVAYGPFRRFTGGNQEWDKIYSSYPNAGAHLSVFGEDVALTEALKWLKELKFKHLLEKDQNRVNQFGADFILKNITQFINKSGLLPYQAELIGIEENGPIFKDGNGVEISVTQLSDGYRSVLSLTFELIRQLIRVFGAKEVFKNFIAGSMSFDLPGVVLIDEIDAHLHPTWQTRIGQWFTQYFPKLQFIVTTHSPLICRACEKGTIWRLAAPGSNSESGEITGIAKDRLVFGNILDAYGTEVFGNKVAISEESNDKLNRLSELNVKSIIGKINNKEKKEYQALKTIFPSE